jgi:hypothetical protein
VRQGSASGLSFDDDQLKHDEEQQAEPRIAERRSDDADRAHEAQPAQPPRWSGTGHDGVSVLNLNGTWPFDDAPLSPAVVMTGGGACVRRASHSVARVTVTAVILSVLALVLSLASLSWQAWTWSRSGPVLRVEVTNMVTDAGSTYGGTPEHYVEVKAVNRGRAAATIQTWGIEVPGGGSIFVMQPLSFSQRLPARVEPHSSASFHIAGDEIWKVSAEKGIPLTKMRPWVQPASGKRIYAKRPVPLK